MIEMKVNVIDTTGETGNPFDDPDFLKALNGAVAGMNIPVPFPNAGGQGVFLVNKPSLILIDDPVKPEEKKGEK